MPQEDATGLNLATGTVDDAMEWVDESGPTLFAREPVSRPLIQYYAEWLEDPDPNYWDEAFAERTWGGVPSPPALLMGWKVPRWTPEEGAPDRSLMHATNVPLPAEKDAIVNMSTETTFHRPILAGDHLNWEEHIDAVSEEKETQLGKGHFITSTTVYRNQDGKQVAENTNTLFRHATPDTDEAASDESISEGRRSLDAADRTIEREPTSSITTRDVEAGESIPSFEFPVTYRKAVENAAATKDFYAGHYDPDFARGQGNDTVYLNTIAFQGLVDKLLLGWLGPHWRVAERTIQIKGIAQAGMVLSIEGEVTDVDPSDDRIEAEVAVVGPNRPICDGSITLLREGA